MDFEAIKKAAQSFETATEIGGRVCGLADNVL